MARRKILITGFAYYDLPRDQIELAAEWGRLLCTLGLMEESTEHDEDGIPYPVLTPTEAGAGFVHDYVRRSAKEANSGVR